MLVSQGQNIAALKEVKPFSFLEQRNLFWL